MNESLRNTIIFTLGAAAGSVVTYFVTKNIFSKMAENEIESVKQTYHEAAENLKIEAYSKDKQIDELEEARKEAFEMNKTYQKILKDAGYEIEIRTEEDKELLDKGWKAYEVGKKDRNEPKIKDSKVVKLPGLRSEVSPIDEYAGKVVRMATEDEEAKYNEQSVDKDAEDSEELTIDREIREMSEGLASRPRGGEPYMIDIEAFSDERPEYDKLTVTYYSGDMTLVDEKEETMDISSTIGNEVLDELSEQNPCLYVRNDDLAIDYEVIWLEAGFAEVNGYE